MYIHIAHARNMFNLKSRVILYTFGVTWRATENIKKRPRDAKAFACARTLCLKSIKTLVDKSMDTYTFLFYKITEQFIFIASFISTYYTNIRMSCLCCIV